MPSSHNRPDGTPCDGVFQWGKTSFKMSKAEIRRECPVCGRREYWHKDGLWHTISPNSEPGSGNWVSGS